MVFSNLFFLYCFLPLLFILYYIFKNDAYRRYVLMLFSLVFYAWGEPVCVLLMIGLVLVDYVFGLIIDRHADSPKIQKLSLVIAVVVNLAVLGIYKYLGFFIDTVNGVTGLSIPGFSIAMPIGISFFTFQTMSYVIDVYRGDTEVQTSFSKLLLYVSFFPQLIAGPIVRYKDIAAQLSDRSVDFKRINDGLFRFALGLSKKVLIADCCDTVVTSLYGLNEATIAARWVGALFFTLQLYFDFSGYSDMAIGLGKMFGFDFLENFNYPLISSSATEFWRRWHMSLGSFFRDYVYIPLGGNRKAHLRNIIVVWFLTGLWHGASWNFVLWGLYYAFFLIIEKKFLLRLFDKIPKAVSFVLTKAYTLFITVFGFAIFYFDKDLWKNLGYLFGVGCDTFTDIFTNSIIFDNIFLLALALILSTPVFPICMRLVEGKGTESNASYITARIVKTILLIALISVCSVRLVGNTYSAFLYFRF